MNNQQTDKENSELIYLSIYLITAIESTGDLTANCMISWQPLFLAL